MMASEKGYDDVVKALLNRNAEVDEQNTVRIRIEGCGCYRGCMGI